MQQIRRDTVKIARHNKVNVDTMSWEVANADTSFQQANRESFEYVMAQPKPVRELTAFDTIQPCDLSIYPQPTAYILKPQPVRNTQDIEEPMNYDILLNGVVFSFALWMSAKYLMGCGAAWSNLFNDLRSELRA
jgi:hypothetical protein